MIVPPSIVGDRFIQLAPAYDSGRSCADGAYLDLDHTGVPVELDDTYRPIGKLGDRRSAPTVPTRTAHCPDW